VELKKQNPNNFPQADSFRTPKAKREAFQRMERIRKKGNIQNDDAELASYREQKYEK
jgi:hypothetical protein